MREWDVQEGGRRVRERKEGERKESDGAIKGLLRKIALGKIQESSRMIQAKILSNSEVDA